MNVFERIAAWMGFSPHAPHPEVLALREALDGGRRAKRGEHYDEAMSEFDRAAALARQHGDYLAVAIVELHRADVYILQGRYEDAAAILTELMQDAESRNEKTQMAYVHCSMGVLAQARGDAAGARQQFEQALDSARQSGASGAEGRAMGHLADTYLKDGNASYAIHLLRDALPRLNTSGDIEMSSYFVGRLGEALIETGQDVEGGQLLNRALRLAEHMQYHFYERQWRLALARRARAQAAYQDAYEHLQRALQLFEALPPSAAYVETLCHISTICLNLSKNQDALEHARRAVALSEQLEDSAAALTARGTLGVVLRSMGQNAEAIPLLEAAAEAEGGAVQIDILRNLGAAQAESGALDDAAATYARAIRLAEASGSRLELAHSRRDAGLLYSRKGQLQQAIQEWTMALAIYEADKRHSQVALLYCDISNARRSLGQGQRAIKDIEKALMALNSVDDPGTRGVVLSNAASAYVDQGDLDTVDSFFSESIKIAQQIGDRPAEATRRGNYAWFLLSTSRAQRAEVALEQALNLSKSLGMELQVAVQTDNLGLVQDELGRPDRALPWHEKALDLIRPLNNPRWEAIVKSNLADTHVALSEVEAAGALFDEALQTGRASEDIELTVRGLIGKARVALKQGQPDAAGELLAEAIPLARRADLRRLLAHALMAQSEQQALLGQAARAADLWNEARRLFTLLQASQANLKPDWLPAVLDG